MKIKEFLKFNKWKLIFAFIPSIMYVLSGIIYSYAMSLAMNGVSQTLLYPIILTSGFFIDISYYFALIPIILLGIILKPFKLFAPSFVVNLIVFIFLFFIWYIIACFLTLAYFKVKKK